MIVIIAVEISCDCLEAIIGSKILTRNLKRTHESKNKLIRKRIAGLNVAFASMQNIIVLKARGKFSIFNSIKCEGVK